MSILVCAVLCSSFTIYFGHSLSHGWIYAGKVSTRPRKMAQVSHFLKLLQFLALFSVCSLSWPPWYCWVLLLAGQYLNVRVYQLLGESGTYYGVRFGKNIPWVTEIPFGYVKDPQYVGSMMSLLACLWCVPFQYILAWMLGYIFMMKIESIEDPATRAKTVV